LKAGNNEKTLLQGLNQHDRKAIETLYKENYNVIQALIINNSGTADDAKDIFQEAMIVLFQKVRSGTFELNCQIKTYIYSVSRRLWLKRLQRQNKFTLMSHHAEDVVMVEEEIDEQEKRNTEFAIMEKAMGNLGEPCKSLLEAFYINKKTMQEIATTFGYTNTENAKTQKYKCLVRLKKIFFTQYKTEAI